MRAGRKKRKNGNERRERRCSALFEWTTLGSLDFAAKSLSATANKFPFPGLTSDIRPVHVGGWRCPNVESAESGSLRPAALKAANEKLTTIAAKMESLERAVAKMQEKGNGGVRTVALEQ